MSDRSIAIAAIAVLVASAFVIAVVGPSIWLWQHAIGCSP